MSDLQQIVGLTPTAITQTEEEITFEFLGGASAKFYHAQDCCETVTVNDVNGDWADLIGQPLLVADERETQGETSYGSETWTFYTFRGLGGSVDVRWHGESNGYYSESVDFAFNPAPST